MSRYRLRIADFALLVFVGAVSAEADELSDRAAPVAQELSPYYQPPAELDRKSVV